ncbi:MAG: hypothetical protein K2G77_00665 [Muribaculaceae bacterium]|nr:hypothetical protein [Muribaculaceae bacterium]
MKFYNYIILASVFLGSLISCDEGRIYNDDTVQTEDGGAAHFSGTVTGADTWSQGYTLALAGFEDGNEYALISKNIETSVSDGKCDITLSGIPGEVTKIELCAVDRLRRRVATFLSADYNPQDGTIQLSAEMVDMSMSAAIQTEIFNTTCVQCHGGNGHAAAGLELLAGDSFSNLISIPSRKIPGMDRVTPGQSAESELFLILDTDISADWNYDHSVEVVRQEKLDLIRNWIDNGAKTEN